MNRARRGAGRVYSEGFRAGGGEGGRCVHSRRRGGGRFFISRAVFHADSVFFICLSLVNACEMEMIHTLRPRVAQRCLTLPGLYEVVILSPSCSPLSSFPRFTSLLSSLFLSSPLASLFLSSSLLSELTIDQSAVPFLGLLNRYNYLLAR